jgi:hypothetical protein
MPLGAMVARLGTSVKHAAAADLHAQESERERKRERSGEIEGGNQQQTARNHKF